MYYTNFLIFNKIIKFPRLCAFKMKFAHSVCAFKHFLFSLGREFVQLVLIILISLSCFCPRGSAICSELFGNKKYNHHQIPKQKIWRTKVKSILCIWLIWKEDVFKFWIYLKINYGFKEIDCVESLGHYWVLICYGDYDDCDDYGDDTKSAFCCCQTW